MIKLPFKIPTPRKNEKTFSLYSKEDFIIPNIHNKLQKSFYRKSNKSNMTNENFFGQLSDRKFSIEGSNNQSSIKGEEKKTEKYFKEFLEFKEFFNEKIVFEDMNLKKNFKHFCGLLNLYFNRIIDKNFYSFYTENIFKGEENSFFFIFVEICKFLKIIFKQIIEKFEKSKIIEKNLNEKIENLTEKFIELKHKETPLKEEKKINEEIKMSEILYDKFKMQSEIEFLKNFIEKNESSKELIKEIQIENEKNIFEKQEILQNKNSEIEIRNRKLIKSNYLLSTTSDVLIKIKNELIESKKNLKHYEGLYYNLQTVNSNYEEKINQLREIISMQCEEILVFKDLNQTKKNLNLELKV